MLWGLDLCPHKEDKSPEHKHTHSETICYNSDATSPRKHTVHQLAICLYSRWRRLMNCFLGHSLFLHRLPSRNNLEEGPGVNHMALVGLCACVVISVGRWRNVTSLIRRQPEIRGTGAGCNTSITRELERKCTHVLSHSVCQLPT